MKKFRLPIRYGIAISGSLIAYFLILSLLGWHTNPIFSLFNSVIVAFGIYNAIRTYKLEQDEAFNYSSGFIVGIITGFMSNIIFTVFFLVYATEINPSFIDELLTVFKSNYNVSVGLVTFVVAIMGFATTVILTLTFMQIFKKSWNIPQNQ